MTLAVPEVVVLHSSPTLRRLSDREFFEWCQLNQHVRIERSAQGDIVIMPPAGGETGRRNFSLAVAFGQWAEADGTGLGFDSSTGFKLPNGAIRSPDLAWVKRDCWQALPALEREVFPPLCPDFVVELRSRSDSLADLQAKLEEYIANGAQLGWLIDPTSRRVFVYRPGRAVEVLDNPAALSGEPVLRGLVLDVRRLWEGRG